MEKQTIVVKVGTSSLTLSDGTMDAEKNTEHYDPACRAADGRPPCDSRFLRCDRAGFSRSALKKRPTKIADKQAAAAVGQGLLMEEYTKNLMAYQIPCAQIF